MATLAPGCEIDGFRVVEHVHTGGTAMLYRVEPPSPTGFPVILKVPRIGPGEDAVNVICHEVEQLMLGVLGGPHVPRLVASGDLVRQPYLAMEYVEGRRLDAWLGGAPLSVPEIVRLTVALATAVHHLHGQQFVHLDLKPANVICRDSGEAVLVDLGLGYHACYPDLLAEDFRKPVGSAPYMAPEQVVGVRCDPRSDIFAIGVVLYQLATGRLPFGGAGSRAALRQRLYREPLPPRLIRPELPQWLQEIILRCLEVDADRRYASAAQLAFELGNAEQVAVTARGRRSRPQGSWRRFKRWLRAAGWEPSPCPKLGEQAVKAPIVMVALATRHDDAAQATALCQAVRRLAAAGTDYRIAVISVIPPFPVLGTSRADESGGGEQLRHQLIMRHWARDLELPAERITFHVLEGNDAADMLLRYARANPVDQIVIGAPPMAGSPEMGVGLRPAPGTVAARVILEAPCTVTVVRSPRIAGSRHD